MTNAIPPNLPDFIQSHVADARFTPVSEGLSEASVWRVERDDAPTLYLKIATAEEMQELEAEVERLQWLQSYPFVPPLIAHGREAGHAYVLTQAIEGVGMEEALQDDTAADLITRAGEWLRTLHGIPMVGCPFDMGLETRLAMVEQQVQQGRVDIENFDEARQGQSVDAVFETLLATRPLTIPIEDQVMTHGDFCPPNVLVNPDTLQVAGVIDWGKAGVADRYQDLALALREIPVEWHSAFLTGYGIAPEALDQERVEFYQLLDEFF